MATPAGTDAYRRRYGDRFGRTYFRRFDGLSISSVGVGTYLGDPTDAVDDAYREAIVAALEGGANVLDTAINYRHQRSERVVGEAIEEAEVDRDAVFVATKGGFLPFDGERPADPGAYLQETYLESGLVDPDDLARGIHCVAPDFLADQLDRSLVNLGVEAVDCYYVHNPETQLAERPASAVYDQLERAFATLEERAADGDLGAYGVATWEAFRVPPGHDQYLSLAEVRRRAEAAAASAGNERSAFRAVQLPFNVVMADAFTVEAHGPGVERGTGSVGGVGVDDSRDATGSEGVDDSRDATGSEGGADSVDGTGGSDGTGSGDGAVSALSYAREADLSVFASASIAQGKLAEAGTIPEAVAERLPGDTPAQRAINFARSAPGVACALVGASSREHVEENLAAGGFDAMGASAFDATFE